MHGFGRTAARFPRSEADHLRQGADAMPPGDIEARVGQHARAVAPKPAREKAL